MAAAKLNDFMAANRGRSFEDVIRELEERIVFLEQYIEWDKHLREQNPALQDLFEKFQSTKKLVGP